MKLAFHLPSHPTHDYLFVMYLDSLMRYCADRGIEISQVVDLDGVKDSIVLADTDYLDFQTVSNLKDNGCKIVGFNLVDSSTIAQACVGHMEHLDLIFSVTGIQLQNVSYEVVFDDHFRPTMEKREFLPRERWLHFDRMRKDGRLLSLPYVHWNRQPEAQFLPIGQKTGKVMLRGGAHFLRVALGFFLMKEGLLDDGSGYPLKDFFSDSMNPQFRYCDECRMDYRRGKQHYGYRSVQERNGCTSTAEWGQHLDLSNGGLWNNRCPRSFYWLANRFEEHHGAIDKGQLEQLFNVNFVTAEEHQRLLGRASFASDLKWIHSIYAAQRFWDAAIVGTVNLLPSRTAEQEYFPAMKPWQHYIVYDESMDALQQDARLEPENYERIRRNAYELYAQWILPGQYKLNTNLLQHIADRITAL